MEDGLDTLINELELISKRLHEVSGAGDELGDRELRKAADIVWSVRNRLRLRRFQ